MNLSDEQKNKYFKHLLQITYNDANGIIEQMERVKEIGELFDAIYRQGYETGFTHAAELKLNIDDTKN